MLDPLKGFVASVQDFFVLTGRAIRNIFRSPHYADDIFMQMDVIGVGSLMIAGMTGFFGGAVMALQMSKALATYGQVSKTGTLVSLTLVRELGPVLTGIMVAGRNASGIASELGSMTVTEQIDAMRALGTDPVRKLVAPRLVALLVTLPLLTLIADAIGIGGGWVVSTQFFGINSSSFMAAVWDGLSTDDIIGGFVKTLAFALIIGTIACHKGLSTEGGTVGVGRSTTSAVVVTSILIIVADYFLTRALQLVWGLPTS